MQNSFLFLVVFTFSLIVNAAYSQLILKGELRPRSEYRHGYKSLIYTGQTGALFTEQRSRLSLKYSTEKYKVGMSIQDIRVWGSQSQLSKTDWLSSFHEAWGEYNFTQKFSIKLGRQEVVYDDDRIFGAVNWTQQGRSHDLIILKFSDSTITVDGGIAYNQNSESNVGTAYKVANNYKEMQFLWVNKKLSQFNASFLIVNHGVQSTVSNTGTRYSQTLGPYIGFIKNKLSASLRTYYQTGTDGATKRDIAAYYAGVDVSYNVNSKLSIGVGSEILSGQSQTDTLKAYVDVNHAFNPLYGSAHKFNGFMDYFYAGNHINSVGLGDFYFKAKYNMKKGWIGLDVHQFISGADVVDKKILAQLSKYKALNSTLGTEIDLSIEWNITKDVSVMTGYSQMFGTKTLVEIKGGSYSRINNWAYLMMTFKPQFLEI